MSHFTSKQFLNYRITLPLIWGCAMLASQALAGAGEAEVLAGRGGPGQVRPAGQVRGLKAPDVAGRQILGAEIGRIGLGLAVVEVVGEQAGPAPAQARARHAAAGEELVEGEGPTHAVADWGASARLSASVQPQGA